MPAGVTLASKSGLTWQCEKNARLAYAGSLRYDGQSGRPGTCCLAAFQNGAEEQLMSTLRKSLEVRARLSRSRGCMRLKIYWAASSIEGILLSAAMR